jgi:hypothetical protein
MDSSGLAFDQQFLDALTGEDELGVVVRGHIHIEAGLNDFISAMIPFPDRLPSGMRYQQKVDLACALGLRAEHAPALKMLGEMRNSFAHKLNVGLSKESLAKLYRTLSPSDREAVEIAYRNTNRKVLSEEGMPFEELDPRRQFILIAITLKGMLLVAVRNARAL